MSSNDLDTAPILNDEITSKIKLILALSAFGLLAWLAYAGLTPPKIAKTFRAETLQFNEEATAAICLESKTEYGLFSKHISKYPASGSYQQQKNYLKKVNTCRSDFAYAIAHDELLESPLYKNKLDDFFKRIRALDTYTQARALMLDTPKLPKGLAIQLDNLPSGRQQTTAFDIALATQRVDDVLATMPKPEDILPHQRQALFHLGAFSMLEHAKANDDQSLAETKINDYQTQMSTALITGNAQIAVSALSLLLGNIGATNQYSDYRGGFSDYDFLMANQRCDLAYATFLTSKKIQPSVRHILHLLSVIGHAQYPEIGDSSNRTFIYASADVHGPNPAQLTQCVALASLYAKQVKDFNDPELLFAGDYQQTNVYDEVYKLASDAVFQWWVRDDEKQYHNARAPNTTVMGDPAILSQTVAEIVKWQPASFEQYCAWASHAHTWTALVKDKQPSMVSPILNLPAGWKNAPITYQTPHRACNLGFGMTDEYQNQKDGLAFINKTLKQVGIPCQGALVKEAGAYQLVCEGKTTPWPVVNKPSEY